jgi:DNA-binding response OmpR family regulator
MSTGTDFSEEAEVPGAIRVLVVDDDRDSVTGLVHLLSDEGFDVVGAHDGEEALSAARTFNPDVVVLDIAMPRLNGWEVARQIRQAKGFRRPLLIGITGVYMEDPDLVLAKMSGFNHYLPKPYELKSLLALLAPVRK